MKCPICGKNTFLELEAGGEGWCGQEGYSVKECLSCDYKVQDRTRDGRFSGIHHVITKPDLAKLGSPGIR